MYNRLGFRVPGPLGLRRDLFIGPAAGANCSSLPVWQANRLTSHWRSRRRTNRLTSYNLPVRVQLDRFEDNEWAVLLNYPAGDRTFDVPREALPGDAAPGDVFTMCFEPDPEETVRLAEENRRLMNELLERNE